MIVPTYREAENIPDLVERIEHTMQESQLDLELLIVDDPSADGTDVAVAELARTWVRLITRSGPRGLSYAVVDGLAEASGQVLLVMDADLSHPPEAIPSMLEALARNDSDFVIGSRYVPGAGTDENWGFLRSVNSKIAAWMARPFTRVKDPMAGYFALRRETYESAEDLDPIGYKIGLELMVKCGCRRIAEVPIHFADRQKGVSKLSLREQLRYLRHLKRLADYKYGALSHLLQFGFVGGMGTLVNLLMFTALRSAGMGRASSLAAAIWLAMTHNYLLNRSITFSYARGQKGIARQYAQFMATCLVGLFVNYLVAMRLMNHIEVFGRIEQLAVIVGVLSGMIFNFAGSKLWIFRRGGTTSRG